MKKVMMIALVICLVMLLCTIAVKIIRYVADVSNSTGVAKTESNF